jgi:hypothetical protein
MLRGRPQQRIQMVLLHESGMAAAAMGVSLSTVNRACC